MATIVLDHEGDIVPADARLLEGDPVEVDQSAPTGESLPATRRSGDDSILRFDRSSGRDRCIRLCHGGEHLFRYQNSATGAGRRKP